jgi:putative SOS response-associated peptidase YedK
MFAFAGIWERWKRDEISKPLETFALLTTKPNDVLRPIHNRMPVILDQTSFARWLDRNNKAADAANLLKPHDPQSMEAWKVSSKVNKPANNDPSSNLRQ